MPIVDLLPIFATIVTVAGALGIVYAVFTSARVQSTINLYKEENIAQGKRIATLDSDVRLATEKLEAIRRENDMLRDLTTGKTAIEAMTVTFNREENLRHQEHLVMTLALEAVKDELVALRTGGGRQG